MSVIPVEKSVSAEAAAAAAAGAEAAAPNTAAAAAPPKAEDSDSADKSAAAAAKAAADAAAAASAAEGRRLYIGNLAYAASEEDIKEFFQGYLVEAVTIPKNPRTEKAVGYAFVDLSAPSESERAIQELAGKEILERKVSVQLAHRPDAAVEKKEGEGKRAGKSPRNRNRSRRRGRKADGEAAAAAPAEGGAAATAAAAGPVMATVTPAAAAAEGPAGEAAPKAAAAQTQAKPPREKRVPEQKRERGPPADGVPSKTKVMVANLPFDLSEDTLREMFAPYEPTQVKIALRPIPRFMIKKLQTRQESRKGRGFGFVSLPSEELQQKAVAEMNGKEVEGREIAVKVAVDSPDKTDEALAAKAAAAEEKKAAAAAEDKKTAPAAAAPAVAIVAAPAEAS
jgi:RNA recognition motif-containing protein